MDKRLPLAAALIILVLFGVPLLFPRPPLPPRTDRRGFAASQRAGTGRGRVAHGSASRRRTCRRTMTFHRPRSLTRSSSQTAVSTISVQHARRRTARRAGRQLSRAQRQGRPRRAQARAGTAAAFPRDHADRHDRVRPDGVHVGEDDATRMAESVVTFTGSNGKEQATVRYQLVNDNYLSTVTMNVTGAASPAFLLVDLPGGFDTQEADTLGDMRALAYSVKPRDAKCARHCRSQNSTRAKRNSNRARSPGSWRRANTFSSD